MASNASWATRNARLFQLSNLGELRPRLTPEQIQAVDRMIPDPYPDSKCRDLSDGEKEQPAHGRSTPEPMQGKKERDDPGGEIDGFAAGRLVLAQPVQSGSSNARSQTARRREELIMQLARAAERDVDHSGC